MKHSIFTIVATAALLGGCGSGDSDQLPVSAHVQIELRWPMIEDTLTAENFAADECRGGRNYADITTGSPVVFRDIDGKAVGNVDLPPPPDADNLVICTWTAVAELETSSDLITAEVGGWKSTPQRVVDGVVEFRLDTVDEDPQFGSTARVDPTWKRDVK